jgi:hypothetical protein
MAILVGVAGVMSVAGGCSPEVLAPKTHPALEAAKVEIIQSAPSKFEDHGLVFSSAINKKQQDFQADAYVDELKAAAGAKGANAILIEPNDKWNERKVRDERYLYIGGFYGKKFYNLPVTTEEPARLVARAIWVEK